MRLGSSAGVAGEDGNGRVSRLALDHAFRRAGGQPPILAGGWNFTASADLSSLLLIPIDSAAIQGAIAGISDYHGGVIRLVLSDEPDAQTAAPRRSVEFSASELFRPPSLVASSVNAVVARDSRGDLKRYLRGARLPVEDVDGDALSDLFLFQTGSAATWSSLTTGGVDGPGNAVTGKSARTYSFAFGQPEGVVCTGVSARLGG